MVYNLLHVTQTFVFKRMRLILVFLLYSGRDLSENHREKSSKKNFQHEKCLFSMRNHIDIRGTVVVRETCNSWKKNAFSSRF